MQHFTLGSESVERVSGAASSVRVAAERARGMIAYMVIFAAGMSGYSGLGLWTIAASAVALASVSQAEYAELYRRGRELGLTETIQSTMIASFANALMAATASYALGWLMCLI